MNRKFFGLFLLFSATLVLSFLAACRTNLFLTTVTPTFSATFEMLATPILVTPTPFSGLTLSASATVPTGTLANSLTLTASMGLTLGVNSSSTPPPWATIHPSVGDLGWGAVYGKITDGVSNLPINGATVKCEHFSSTSPYLCNGITTTNSDGIYTFTTVFFHETDRIRLIVEAPGYAPLRFEQSSFARPEFHADLGLFRSPADGSLTPTPFIMCTPPACQGGQLTCGNPNGCPGGCGTICIQATPAP